MLQGKVVLVTGGTDGIGRTTARAIAAAGGKVTVSGRRAEEGRDTVRLIEADGGEALFVQGDVSREADVERMVAETVARFGRLDGAFNNAGIGAAGGKLADMPGDSFDAMFDINVRGVFLSMKHEIRQFLKQGGGGAIVNCSSIQAHVTIAGSGHYPATKHAVEGYTKMAALEYAENGIRINAVSPGVIIDGRLGAGPLPPEFQKMLLDLHPIGRFGTAQDVADSVIFLLSDKAGFVTGSSLVVDGGYMAR
jgi:NAD(P)-dependent dehydrogenase (short-subunit alcohol dehydrogenase family)